jgi:ABC-type transporter Mla MlaB component
VGTGSHSCHDVYNDGVLRISRAGIPPVLVIAGEIDESTYPALAGTLRELADGQSANGPGETHINLAGLTYCDLTGLRAIIGLAASASDGSASDGTDGGAADGQGPAGRCGTRLVLHEVPAHLRTVLQVVGWDTAPGLSYDGGEG